MRICVASHVYKDDPFRKWEHWLEPDEHGELVINMYLKARDLPPVRVNGWALEEAMRTGFLDPALVELMNAAWEEEHNEERE